MYFLPQSRVGSVAAFAVGTGTGGAVSSTWQGSATDQTTQTTYTFSSQPFGTANAARRVMVGIIGYVSSRVISSLTIGGVTAERAGFNNSASTGTSVEFWWANVPTGTTGTVAVTWSGSQSATLIGIWTTIGDIAVYGHLGASLGVSANSSNVTVNTSSTGFVLACGLAADASPVSATPRGMAADANFNVGGNIRDATFASTSTSGSTATVGMDGNGTSPNTNSAYLALAFGPKGAAADLDAFAPSGAWSMGRYLYSKYAGPVYDASSGNVIRIYNQVAGAIIRANGNSPSGNFTDLGTSAQRPAVTTYGTNSRAAADFDGSNHYLTSTAMSDFILNTDLWCYIVASFDTINFTLTANPNAGNCVIGDTAAIWGVYGNDASGTKKVYGVNYDGNPDSPTAPTQPLNQLSVFAIRHQGSNVYLSVDGGAEVSTASGNTTALTNLLRIGFTAFANGKLDGKIAECAIWGASGYAVPGSTDRATIISAVKTYYGI